MPKARWARQLARMRRLNRHDGWEQSSVTNDVVRYKELLDGLEAADANRRSTEIGVIRTCNGSADQTVVTKGFILGLVCLDHTDRTSKQRAADELGAPTSTIMSIGSPSSASVEGMKP